MRKHILLLITCLLSLAGSAQNPGNDSSGKNLSQPSDADTTGLPGPSLRSTDMSLIPHGATSPQAEAFQRLGEYTVNNSSGMPDISIPLYEIDHCGYKIPLTLRYLASPLRSSYNYDVIGHGWGINYGFCITRTAEMIRDEASDFKLREQILQKYYSNYENCLDDYNLRYDQFHATLPDGSSFSFFMRKVNNQMEYRISDRKQWRITCSVNSYNIEGFTVTDNSGIKYYFTKADYALGVQYTYNVAWYLTRIELPNTTTPILFQYDQNIKQVTVSGQAEPVLTVERRYAYPFDAPDISKQYTLDARVDFPNTNTNYKMPLLSSICYGPTSVRFTYQYPDYEREFNYLDKMVVFDNNTAVKEFRFSYQKRQFVSNPLASLTRLVEKGAAAGSDSLVYLFNYSGLGSMYATDHWGYRTTGSEYWNVGNFNAYMEIEEGTGFTSGNQHVTVLSDNPLEPYGYIKAKLANHDLSGDPREGSDAVWHNYLTSITYPTGGRTEFVFEPHRFVTATNAQGDYTPVKRNRRVMQGGGFRIKKISNYTADGQLADVRTFCYGPTFQEANSRHLNLPLNPANMSLNHIGFGEPVVDPNIMTYTNFKNSTSIPLAINTMLLGTYHTVMGNHYDPFQQAAGSATWRWECSFSPLFFRGLLKGRNAVVYPEITEYHGDITNLDTPSLPVTGKTVYKYNIYNDMEDSVYAERIVYYGHVLDCNEDRARRDWLTEKEVYRYDGTFHLQQKEEYIYYFYEQDYVYDFVFGNIYTSGDYNPSVTVRSVMYDKVNIMTNRLLIQKRDTLFTPTGPYSDMEIYEYNDKDMLLGSSVKANWVKSTSYTYPSGLATSPPIERELTRRNMMTTVLQQKTRVAPNGLLDVSGYKTDYAMFDFGDTLLLPSRLYRLNTSYSGSGFEEEEQVLSYTANAHPVEVVDRSGMHSVYLWGYNDRYLIAEIRNATYSQVSSAVSSVFGMGITALANAVSPNETLLRSLHSYVGLGSAMVSTWTYRPLVGVTSSTDPAGMTTYYDYDGLGRLREVYRYEGNTVSPSNKRILNQYDYHTITH